MIIVSDTSVISNLLSLQQLALLVQLYQEVIIPEAVYQELAVLGEPMVQQLEQPWLQVRQVTALTRVEALQKQARLDRGESEAIVLAQELQADLLLIDERRGRAEAQRLGIPITGLLGMLLEAKMKGLIPAVKPLMDQLIAESLFRVSPALYDLILQKAQEGEQA